MTVLEFCNVRNIQTQTVLKYIQRNPSIFEGHTSKNGQNMEIDDEAFKVLDDKYPIPPEIIPSPNAELVAELDKAKNVIIQLQQQIIDHNDTLALAEKAQFLLDERSSQLIEMKASRDELQGENSELHEEIGRLKAQLAQAEQEASRASQEAEKLRNRTFWQRLFNT